MRRFQVLSILAAGLILVAAACGGSDHEDESIPQTGDRPTNTTLATTTTTAPEGETTTTEGGEGEGESTDTGGGTDTSSTTVGDTTTTSVTDESTTTTTTG